MSGFTNFQAVFQKIAYGPINPETDINDEYFYRDLKKLKELRSFLTRQAVSFDPNLNLSLGSLNLLRLREQGRSPTKEEWMEMERLTQLLFGLLSALTRHKFLMGAIPWWITALPVALAAVAFIALILSTSAIDEAIHIYQAANPIPFKALSQLPSLGSDLLMYYILWLMALGATGSVAFIGMNALSVQDDATFDLTNTKLMLLRITLGALFGVVLTLPFGFDGYINFSFDLSKGFTGKPVEATSMAIQSVLLLLPFILGFSTSLVIMILNQFVEAVQSFFGKRAASPPAEPAPAPGGQVAPAVKV